MRYRTVMAFWAVLILGGVSLHGAAPSSRNNQQIERTIAADPHAVISACVTSGSLTIHGWDRNEIRARTDSGIQIELTRIDQIKSGLATEVKLTASQSGDRVGSRCLAFGEIELNVPRAASLKLQTNAGDIRVTESGSVTASSQSGSILLAKVQNDVKANTISGEISVSDASGSFKLQTVSGSIDARNLGSTTATDAFQATTVSGDVTLNNVRQAQLKMNTVSGEINYVGVLSPGGHYKLQSMSGPLRLSLPAESSFRLTATVGSEVKVTSDFETRDYDHYASDGPNRSMRRIETIAGKGEASIVLSLFSGSLQIRKR